MCKNFLEDVLFKDLFTLYFYNGVDSDSLVEIDRVILSFDSEVVWDVLNIIKACVVSETPFKESYKLIRDYIDVKNVNIKLADKFILSLTLKHLINLKSDGIEQLIRVRRDFISEAISEHLKIPLKDITDDMKKDMIIKEERNYSVNDSPVKNWDEYFFNICRQAARNSKCLSRRVGSVLVKDKSILSTGYNGPPRGIPRCDLRWSLDANFMETYGTKVTGEVEGICPRKALGAKSGELLDLCIAGHAEENAILNAARMGICTKDTTLYMNCNIPCFRCVIKIINAGVSEIVVKGLSFNDDNSEFLLNNSDVKVRLYNF